MPWSPESRARAAERMRRLHADPAFKEKHAPFALLNDEQRKLYRKCRNCGLARADALAQVRSAAP